MKKLLILNGSLSEATLIETAKRLGYYVITSGNNPSLMGHTLADEYIEADYSDKEKILSLVKEHHIDCIVSCANDFGVITSAYVAQQMGWSGHDTYENAVLLHQKDLFKTFIQKLGIRTPFSIPFDDIGKAKEFVKTAQYPMIVKATDLTGGKGIKKADDYTQALSAIDNAFEKSRIKHIVIEPFIEGVQQSLVTFISDKKVVASVSCDCFFPINPYLIQSELLPAKNIEQYQEELHDYIELICKTLNLVDGMLTLQYIVKDGKPYIIELMRRALGNQFLTVAGAVTGFPWEEALIKAETGMPLTNLRWNKPMTKYAGHHGIMATKNGIVKDYSIAPELESHIFKKIDVLPSDKRINDYLNERIAYIYYQYNNYDEAITTVSHINDLVTINMK